MGTDPFYEPNSRVYLVRLRTALANKIHALLAKNGITNPYSELSGFCISDLSRKSKIRFSGKRGENWGLGGNCSQVPPPCLALTEGKPYIEKGAGEHRIGSAPLRARV